MSTADHPAVWIPLIVLVTIVIVACLIDIVRRPRGENLPKASWCSSSPSERSPTWLWVGAGEQH